MICKTKIIISGMWLTVAVVLLVTLSALECEADRVRVALRPASAIGVVLAMCYAAAFVMRLILPRIIPFKSTARLSRARFAKPRESCTMEIEDVGLSPVKASTNQLEYPGASDHFYGP